MAKTLTAAAIGRFKPGSTRREVADGGCRGLYLTVEPSGMRSFAFRYRRPSGASARLVLGRFDASGQEAAGEPKIGDPLSLSAARLLAADCERQRLRGIDPGAAHLAAKQQARVVAAETAAQTFAACVRQCIDEHEVKSRKPRMWRASARTLGLDYPVRGGEPKLIPHGLAERWASRPVTEIGASDIHAVVDESRRHGTPGIAPRNVGMSDVRGIKMLDALNLVFGWLMRHRRITTNPTAGLWRPAAAPARDRALGSDEIKWFWKACDEIGSLHGAIYKLLLITGCRRREIGELRWSELSDDFATLRLPPERTKNHREHVLTLPPAARDILAAMPRIAGAASFVFTITGKYPIADFAPAKRRLDEAMGRLAGEEGKSVPAWRIHDLRRTAATGLADLGVNPFVIEHILNHASGHHRGGPIAQIYNRSKYLPETAAALVLWAEHVRAIVEGRPAKVVALKRGA
jgi:integrase